MSESPREVARPRAWTLLCGACTSVVLGAFGLHLLSPRDARNAGSGKVVNEFVFSLSLLLCAGAPLLAGVLTLASASSGLLNLAVPGLSLLSLFPLSSVFLVVSSQEFVSKRYVAMLASVGLSFYAFYLWCVELDRVNARHVGPLRSVPSWMPCGEEVSGGWATAPECALAHMRAAARGPWGGMLAVTGSNASLATAARSAIDEVRGVTGMGLWEAGAPFVAAVVLAASVALRTAWEVHDAKEPGGVLTRSVRRPEVTDKWIPLGHTLRGHFVPPPHLDVFDRAEAWRVPDSATVELDDPALGVRIHPARELLWAARAVFVAACLAGLPVLRRLLSSEPLFASYSAVLVFVAWTTVLTHLLMAGNEAEALLDGRRWAIERLAERTLSGWIWWQAVVARGAAPSLRPKEEGVSPFAPQHLSLWLQLRARVLAWDERRLGGLRAMFAALLASLVSAALFLAASTILSSAVPTNDPAASASIQLSRRELLTQSAKAGLGDDGIGALLAGFAAALLFPVLAAAYRVREAAEALPKALHSARALARLRLATLPDNDTERPVTDALLRAFDATIAGIEAEGPIAVRIGGFRIDTAVLAATRGILYTAIVSFLAATLPATIWTSTLRPVLSAVLQ